jgi:hypothetical protein
MVSACICEGEVAIRNFLKTHIDELVREKQEVRIAWKKEMTLPLVCVIRWYEPPGDSEYADALFVYPGGENVHIISPSQVTHFEVLPTKKMDSRIAFAQMKEMERAGKVLG